MFIDGATESVQLFSMVYFSTLSWKYHTTLPKEVVAILEAKPSSTLVYETLENGTVLLTAKSKTFKDIAGSFPKKKAARPITGEDMKRSIRQLARRER